ncbi:Crp/Fnr family transcriptional regulator [Thalassoglobus polymorphus]|uniref:cAMP receptor protein n=1 Tax=Thalassoglobus polymorphus TaxID=2527994 RepID=A0A517QNQ4_9PLAN|nr:Crp/Fnr family transcriptional regulator [Thalassoglobus polymorphus]QDT33259.1 cAMP receptor protein [Thalassoglobus polymorphus]
MSFRIGLSRVYCGMEDKFWYLKNCPLFEKLSERHVQELESQSRSRTFMKGGMIYMPADHGESVYLLTSGRIKLYHITPDGKQTLLAFIEPGEIFGELAVFDAGGREEFAEAMLKSTLIKIPKELIQRYMEQHSEVALGVTKLMGFRRQRIERRLKSLLFRSNRERLVHLLVELADQYGTRISEGVRLEIKLSHQELASIIGSTRETVTVVLGELQSEGSIIIQRRQIILTQIERLARSIEMCVPNIPVDSPFINRNRRPARYGV